MTENSYVDDEHNKNINKYPTLPLQKNQLHELTEVRVIDKSRHS